MKRCFAKPFVIIMKDIFKGTQKRRNNTALGPTMNGSDGVQPEVT